MAKKLWGGRFRKKTDPLVEEFTKSIQYDYRLAKFDLIGSFSHIQILKKAGYLTPEEFSKLNTALGLIAVKFQSPKFKPNLQCEDIHTYIQNELQKKVGDLALKLHTARSRNDQVVFATKLYCNLEIEGLQLKVDKLIIAIGELVLSKDNKDIIIPGFTHMQHAQPVYLRDYFWSYFEMLKRDAKRLKNINANLVITMGAGALAGTPIDAIKYNVKVSELLDEGKDFFTSFNIQKTENSLDIVSDRDFVIEILSALAIVGMHLSRLSEDLIIWSTKEFDFVEIDESFCTGSSLMPQKKNPDVLELIRGYAGRLYGNLTSVLTMMKGLPLTYNRDMQLDKEPLFNSIDIVNSELNIMAGLVKTLKFNTDKIEEQLKDEALYATDLVYYLVDLGIPFTKAHALIGELVRYSIENSTKIEDMPEDVLKKKLSSKVSKNKIVEKLDAKVSVESKKSIDRKKAIEYFKAKD